MKFRLSTFLAIVTTAGISLAWYMERQNSIKKDAAHTQRVKEVISGAESAAYSIATIEIADQFANSRHKHRTRDLMNDFIIRGLIELWHSEDNVNASIEPGLNGSSATWIAAQAMDSLKCESVDQFYAITKSTEPYYLAPEMYPEIFDTGAAEYKSFHDFISRVFLE